MKLELKDLDHGFIVTNLHTRVLGLRGPELLVFALIHSFSSVGRDFIGSRKYISAVTGLSSATVSRALKSLLDKGMLTKEKTEVGDKTKTAYAVDGYCIRKAVAELKERLGIKSVPLDEAEIERIKRLAWENPI